MHALRDGELTVKELCTVLSTEQSSLSQQLAVLRSRDIVAGRKEGLNVFYSVNDPTVFKLLDVARQIFHNQLISYKSLLAENNATLGRARR